MKSLTDYPIFSKFHITIQSRICSAANLLVGDNLLEPPVSRRVNDLSTSYFNQSRTIVESYQALYGLFIQLGNRPIKSARTPEYDVSGLIIERHVVILSHLFLISMKGQLDLMIILSDLLINKKVRKLLPDFNSFLYKDPSPETLPLVKDLQRYRDTEPRQWLQRVMELRNRLIHRGYNLRLIDEMPGDKLVLYLYDGMNKISTDFPGIQTIDIESFFEEYLAEIVKLDNIVTQHVLATNKKDLNDIKNSVSFSFNDIYEMHGTTPIQI